MTAIHYAAVFAPQCDGGFTVTFPDIPEAITEGDDRDSAMFNAQEVLTLCLEQRMVEGDEISLPKTFFASRVKIKTVGRDVGLSSYSPSVSNDALPPAAVVLTVSVRSVTKRSK